MKSVGAEAAKKAAAKAETGSANAATEAQAASTVKEVIDFSNVKIEPLFEETVDFETFSSPTSVQSRLRSALQFRSPRSFYSSLLMMEQALTEQSFPESMHSMSRRSLSARHSSPLPTSHQEQ